MYTYIAKRLLVAIPTVLIISVFVFSLQKLLPGDPILAMAGEERDPQVLEYLREKYRLNDPVPIQYFHWLGGVLQGDLGISLRTNQPVTELIAEKLPVTIQLAIMAIIFAFAIGIPMGILAAVKKNTVFDYLANFVALSGLSIPNFWLGIMLILLVSVRLGGCRHPATSRSSSDPVRSLQTMIMPAFVLGNALAATLMRHTRSAMLSVLSADYIRTARAKGLAERAVVLEHSFRNALLPIVTLSALLFGELLAGAVLTEQIFTIPGFGKLIVDAVFNRDYAVVQGVVLCTAVGLHPDEPPRRHPLFRAQSPHEDGLMTVLSPTDAANLPTQRAPSRAWRKLKANKGALAGCIIIGFSRCLRSSHRCCRYPTPTRRIGRRSARPLRCCIGSAPTTLGATISRA